MQLHVQYKLLFSTSQSCTFNLKQLIKLKHKKNHQINIIITVFRKLIFRHNLQVKDNAHVHNIQNFEKMYNTLFTSKQRTLPDISLISEQHTNAIILPKGQLVN